VKINLVSVIRDTFPIHSGPDTLGMETPGRNFASTLLFALDCFVLTNAPPSSKDTEHDGENTTSNDDATTHLVPRFLRAKEKVGTEPMRDAGYAVGNGNEGSTLGTRTRNDCSFPRELDVEPHERTGAQQDEGEVACAGIQGRDHKNCAGESDGNTRNDVPAVLKHPAG
jgi:hypothetical protein